MSTSIFGAVAGEGWKDIQKEYWYHMYHTDVIVETIYLYSNRLTLGLSTCVCYAGWCMTDFDLPTNYLDDPEVLLRKAKASLKKVLTLESKDNWIRKSLTPEFEAMATRFTVNSLLQPPPTSVLDHKPLLERMDSSSSQLLSTWCKLVSYMERHMKMRVHISNTFWRSAALSLSKE
jgi:hypothetical protein